MHVTDAEQAVRWDGISVRESTNFCEKLKTKKGYLQGNTELINSRFFVQLSFVKLGVSL